MRILIVGLVVVGCGGGQRMTLNTSAVFPTLGPLSRCRVAVGPVSPVVGHVVLAEIEGEARVRRIAGAPGDVIELKGGVLHVDNASTLIRVRTERDVCLGGVSPRCLCRIHVERQGDRDVPVQSIAPTKAQDDARCVPTRDSPARKVPPGHVFLLADNRDAAIDSRAVGPVPLSKVSGRVLACRR